MRLAVQVIGVPVIAAAAAAVGSAAVSAAAERLLGVCDPKFGCSFGLQFGAGMSALVGFLLGIFLLCILAGFTAATSRLVAPRTSLLVAATLGLTFGASWSAVATASYM